MSKKHLSVTGKRYSPLGWWYDTSFNSPAVAVWSESVVSFADDGVVHERENRFRPVL